MNRRLRVVVADDHEIWRSGLRADLGDDFVVVAEAPDAPEAIRAVRREVPDLVLCDLNMPGGGGLAVVRAVAEVAPVVILTVSEAERDLLDTVAAGAVGYLLKSTRSADLEAALRLAAEGEPVFSPQLAALLIGEFRRLASHEPTGATGEDPRGAATTPLSPREREVLGLVARGRTYKQVGAELFISPKTVENHVRNTMAKLHLSRRNELIRWAVDHGID
ncbi:MAG: response regulator transcription factor [Microthrixaceae bacterium]|nr:response regulator transcription factor [Microthrixaceae bacterium]MCO5318191.1 response regulator transcription factor [Microthrixaceae bacterium]